jgi:RNA polymerase primary sigma factor
MKQIKITQSFTRRESLSFEKYLNEISKISTITQEEEFELCQKIKAGDSKALEKLTKANLRFVVSVAKQYQNQGMPLCDLVNEGNLGLIKAAKKFDVSKGFKFISYAVWWIRQSIIHALMEESRMVRMPLTKTGMRAKLIKSSNSFLQNFEREPSTEELAELLNLKENEILQILQTNNSHLSVDAPIGNSDSDSDNMSMLDQMKNEEFNPEKSLFAENNKNIIYSEIEKLSERERKIIVAYFGLHGNVPMNLEDIGNLVGLTRERVRQLKDLGLKNLSKSKNSSALRSCIIA